MTIARGLCYASIMQEITIGSATYAIITPARVRITTARSVRTYRGAEIVALVEHAIASDASSEPASEPEPVRGPGRPRKVSP